MIDYAALAQQNGGTEVTPKTGVDYAALAAKANGTPTAPPSNPLNGFEQIGNIGKGVFNAVTSNEQTFGKALSTIGSNVPGVANQINTQNTASQALLLHAIHVEPDAAKKQHMLDAYQKIWGNVAPTTAGDINPAFNMTPGQVIGSAAGTALDIASVGSYGNAAKGAETGSLLVKGGGTLEGLAGKVGLSTSEKIAAPVAETVGKQALGQTLKDIGIKTAERAGIGGATGYGYDVSQNLQNGKTGADALAPGWGTALGIAVPAGIGTIQAATAVTSATAPRIINSLIKPLNKDFAYGKNPGQTISEMGITGNNLEDFSNNIVDARKTVGQQLGDLTSGIEGKASLNLTNVTSPIDAAIEEAQKTPETNKALIARLEGVKSDLGNYIEGDGNHITFAEGIDAKGTVGNLTKWTGSPSDDKIVNKALQQVYGIINDEIMSKAQQADPAVAAKMADLNEKYGGLLSAESAINHANAAAQRAASISMPIKVGTVAGVIAAVGTGGVGLPAVLAGVGAGVLDKALGSTAVKSRVAAWLGSESPGVISQVLEKNPAIKTVLYRALPKFASQLGQTP